MFSGKSTTELIMCILHRVSPGNFSPQTSSSLPYQVLQVNTRPTSLHGFPSLLLLHRVQRPFYRLTTHFLCLILLNLSRRTTSTSTSVLPPVERAPPSLPFSAFYIGSNLVIPEFPALRRFFLYFNFPQGAIDHIPSGISTS